MIDPDVQKQMLDFIQDEATRIKYGKLFIELSVVDSHVLDMECTPKKRIHLTYKKVTIG